MKSKMHSYTFLAVVLGLFLIFFKQTNAELTLERIDAIADLSSLAEKYFSDEPNAEFEEPGPKIINSFAWSISGMWDETESVLYVLTRLARLVDEKDETGAFSVAARVIRSFAIQSESRRVYMTEEASEIDRISSSSTSLSSEEDHEVDIFETIEALYKRGKEEQADLKIKNWIDSNWTGIDRALEDIEASGMAGRFKVMGALIRFGSAHRSLKYIAPELKASLCLKFLTMSNFEADPFSARWLLTMDTYREDQIRLVHLIETNVQGRTFHKMTRGSNTLMEVMEEIESILFAGNVRNYSEDTLDEEFIEDDKQDIEAFYDDNDNEVEEDPKMKEYKTSLYKNIKSDSQATAIEAPAVEPRAAAVEGKVHEEAVDSVHGRQNYFEDERRREEETERNNSGERTDINFDNDGIWDDQEKAEDRVGMIIAGSLILFIICVALGSYSYLRMRRARRNRTLIVATQALNPSA